MGRTGTYFAWQDYGVKPDIMTCAKALGCGVPVGAFVLGEKAAAASLEPGDHGTTYGGNPFVCAAVSKVFDIFEKDHILEHVRELTPYLEEKLDALVDKYEIISRRKRCQEDVYASRKRSRDVPEQIPDSDGHVSGCNHAAKFGTCTDWHDGLTRRSI